MRDSMDGMYDNNFYFNNPVDYMASEHDPWFFHRSSRACYTWFTYSDKGGDLGFLQQYASSDIRLVTSEYKKSGKKLDMGNGCVRFKSLEDLALDVVSRTVARVSAEEHMANYQATRAPLGKDRNAGEGAAGLSRNGLPSKQPGFPRAAQRRAPGSPR